jgi:hypothetical protein
LARLTAAALHQAKEHAQDDVDDPRARESDDENQEPTRAARHSKSNGEVKPDTMAYYKGTPWWAILTQAKIKYRRHIALVHGFPDRDEHLGDARDILLEAIEDFVGENEILDQSGFYLLYICTFTYHSYRFPTSTRNGLFSTFNTVFEWPLIHFNFRSSRKEPHSAVG